MIIAPLKGEKRADEKVAQKYGGDYSRLHDVVRATIAVDSKDEIPRAVDALRKNMEKKGWKLAEVDNRMEKPLPSGYRDIATKWESPKGYVTEIQINTKSMIRAKEGPGHKMYEEYRRIMESAGKSPSSDAVSRMKTLEADMEKLYAKAWEE